jgi:hypothetical protein
MAILIFIHLFIILNQQIIIVIVFVFFIFFLNIFLNIQITKLSKYLLNKKKEIFSFKNSFRTIPKLEIPSRKKQRLVHGASVPDLRSDGESSSNDRTPPSISSSSRSSNNSANIWTGSLPNLTIQLTTQQQTKEINRKKNDPYATYADNLNHIDENETMSPLPKKVE